jgi:hypothetical protein
VWDGRWHHSAGTWDRARSLLYVDGVRYDGANSTDTIDYNLPEPDTTVGGYYAGCDSALHR